MHVQSEGALWVISGASRNGKSVLTGQMVGEFDRALVWDVDDEYTGGGFVRVRGMNNLINTIMLKGLKKQKIAYVPASLAEFDLFCEVAIAYAMDLQERGIPGLAVVVEETADVTTPSKAPANFRILIGRGMKRGISLFCVTQRPSESDKTSLGNAKFLVSFYMARQRDREYIAAEIGCSAEDIENLERLEYIKKDVDARRIVRGKIQF